MRSGYLIWNLTIKNLVSCFLVKFPNNTYFYTFLFPFQTFEDFKNDKQAVEYQQRIVDILLKVSIQRIYVFVLMFILRKLNYLIASSKIILFNKVICCNHLKILLCCLSTLFSFWRQSIHSKTIMCLSYRALLLRNAYCDNSYISMFTFRNGH